MYLYDGQEAPVPSEIRHVVPAERLEVTQQRYLCESQKTVIVIILKARNRGSVYIGHDIIELLNGEGNGGLARKG